MTVDELRRGDVGCLLSVCSRRARRRSQTRNFHARRSPSFDGSSRVHERCAARRQTLGAKNSGKRALSLPNLERLRAARSHAAYRATFAGVANRLFFSPANAQTGARASEGGDDDDGARGRRRPVAAAAGMTAASLCRIWAPRHLKPPQSRRGLAKSWPPPPPQVRSQATASDRVIAGRPTACRGCPVGERPHSGGDRQAATGERRARAA